MTKPSSYCFQRWNSKPQYRCSYNVLAKILGRPLFTTSTPTPHLEADEDSWGSWQQLTIWSNNSCKHRSQLIIGRNSRDSFQESTKPLSVHSIFQRWSSLVDAEIYLPILCHNVFYLEAPPEFYKTHKNFPIQN
jgi:hypothetical protein